MTLPYSRIEVGDLSTEGDDAWVLIGANGPRLVVQASSGARSVWQAEDTAKDEEPPEVEEPPGKRIKLSPQAEVKSNFSCLALSNDKKHLVAVTAEDKCIRVFQIDSKFQLNQLSQRCMARRPSAISITSDDSTILCADKFGDVYALPLIPPPDDGQKATSGEKDETVEEKPYVPAASLLTVHSGRNRKVLEEQLKQGSKGPKKPKEAPTFKHELLLGHVSLLTDILYTTVDGRSYILTADRDEHIRVSRGPPQAHIIEGFCYGHEAFVSRLCLARSGLLVSGGGDPYLFIWDWLKCQLLEKLSIRDAVLHFLRSKPDMATALPEHPENFKVAVSGIWSVPCDDADMNDILVACEGVPALFSFRLGNPSTARQVVPLSGNALDVGFIWPSRGACIAVVSVDNMHVPGSTTEVRSDEIPFRLQYFSHQKGGHWGEDAAAGEALEWFSRSGGQSNKAEEELKANRDILYGLENLRKRPGSED